jgi:hypothetical protein
MSQRPGNIPRLPSHHNDLICSPSWISAGPRQTAPIGGYAHTKVALPITDN